MADDTSGMQASSESKMLGKVLSTVGLELKQSTSMPDGALAWQFASKSTKQLVYSQQDMFSTVACWKMLNYADVVSALSHIRWMQSPDKAKPYLVNPYYGCSSLEEMAVKADLLAAS